MKILFYTPQEPTFTGYKADYMSDLLFHGLRQLYGADCVDYPKKDHMYQGYPLSNDLWGHGFSYSETLIDISVDRDDIESKIKQDFYDLIVISIHHTIQLNHPLCCSIVASIDKPSRTILVDGHDWMQYNIGYWPYIRRFFKREVNEDTDSRIIPIWFAIPKEKIVDHIPNKIKDFAYITPGSCDAHWPVDSRKTHIYTKEEDYYRDYQEAFFALTCKKGGWDCMRHVEILANGCIPIFTDIELCPHKTLYYLPKQLFRLAKRMPGVHLASSEMSLVYSGDKIIQGKSTANIPNDLYFTMISEMLEYTREFLHTEFLAKYILERL